MKFIIALLLSLPLLLPSRVFAHSGSGPPFAKLNEKFAVTNPLFLGTPTENGLTNPQDLAVENYQVNTPINFSVDLSQLGVAPEEVGKMELHWKFYQGDNLDKSISGDISGISFTKTFQKPGSYLVSIQAKTSTQSELLLLDTIYFNILPYSSYSLPKITVHIESHMKSGQLTTFTNTTPGNYTYLWDFGDGKVLRGKSVNYTFPQDYFYTPVMTRVIDKNGFITDEGILTVGDKGALSFSPLNPKEKSDFITIVSKKSSALPYGILVVLNLTLIIVVIIIYFLKQKRMRK